MLNGNNQLTVMCLTRGERRLISIRCQKECEESKLDGQPDSQSDNSAHMWVVKNFFTTSLKNISVIGNFDFIYFSIWFSAVFYVLNSPSSLVTVLDINSWTSLK